MLNAAQLDSRDGLLLAFFGLWFMMAASLTVYSLTTGGSFFGIALVDGADSAERYPRLRWPAFYEGQYQYQTGDVLLSVNGIDMGGASTLSGYATLMTQASRSQGDTLNLVVQRDGQRLELREQVSPYGATLAAMLAGCAYVVCAVLVFLAAPKRYLNRTFFVAAMAYGTHTCLFVGISDALNLIQAASYTIAATLGIAFAYTALQAFPSGQKPSNWWQRLWPWGLAIVIVVSATSAGFNVPTQTEEMLTLRAIAIVLSMLVIMILLVQNYRKGNQSERDQIKWVLLGAGVTTFFVATTVGLTLWDSAYAPLTSLLDYITILFPACVFMALVGYRAMDVDRVLGAFASYGTVAIIGLAVIAMITVPLGQWLVARTNVEPQLVYVALSLTVCLCLLPIHRFLRPFIETRFFPARRRLFQATQELEERLIQSGSERALLQRWTDGLALLQGTGVKKVDHPDQQAPEGYTLALQPGVGPDLYFALRAKPSGDIFSARDKAALRQLANTAERRLLQLRNQATDLARQTAEQLAAEKSLFLASASHDLRQPMHALGLFSQSLAERNQDPELDSLVGHIQRSTQALDGMFNSILDLSKIDAGMMAVNVEPMPLQLLFEELEIEFTPLARAKDIEISFVPTSMIVQSDFALLGRVLRNLVSNAIRYTDSGKVLVGCRYGRTLVKLQVLDSGAGIRPEDQNRIFAPYARLDNKVENGLGLGLSLVDKLCDLMRHPIVVSSTFGRGSCFSLHLPRATSRKQIGEAAASVHPVVYVRDEKLRTLAIDDDPTIRSALQELLHTWQHEIETLDSLQSLRVWLQSDAPTPDVLLVDLHMKNEGDGIKALQCFWQARGFVPALLITGDAQAGTYQWVAGHHVSVLNKPLSAERLRSAINELTHTNRAKAGRAR